MSEGTGELPKFGRRQFFKRSAVATTAAALAHLFGKEKAAAQTEFNADKIKTIIESSNRELRELASIIDSQGSVDNIARYIELSRQRGWNLTQLMQRGEYAHMARGLFLDDDTITTILRNTPELLIETAKSDSRELEGIIGFHHDEYFSPDGQVTVVSYPVIRGEEPLDIHEIYSDRYQTEDPEKKIDLSLFPRGSMVRAKGRMLGSAMFIDKLTLVNP